MMVKTATITFDTPAYANKLKAVGIAANVAEAHANANAELFGCLIEDTLATKQDMRHLEHRLEHKIKDLDHRLGHKIKDLETKLTLRLGTMMAVGIGILATLMSILHLSHWGLL
jgi:deoxyribodipyrimidine photolyase-like uncharacterized protein